MFLNGQYQLNIIIIFIHFIVNLEIVINGHYLDVLLYDTMLLIFLAFAFIAL